MGDVHWKASSAVLPSESPVSYLLKAQATANSPAIPAPKPTWPRAVRNERRRQTAGPQEADEDHSILDPHACPGEAELEYARRSRRSKQSMASRFRRLEVKNKR